MAILVRDFLLNTSTSVDQQERQELLAIGESLFVTLPIGYKIAADVAQLNAASLEHRQAEIRSLQREAGSFLLGAVGFASAFGFLLAGIVV